MRFFAGAAILIASGILPLLAAGPFPSGVTRGTAPFVVKGNTGSVNASSPSQNGYMSAVQASDLNFVLSGGTSPDPLTATRWSSANGIDRMTTTATVDSNMEFSGPGGPNGQLQSIGGVTTTLADSGTRANTTDITGTNTESGAGTWTKSAFCSQGVGVSSNQFYPAAGSPDCSDVNTTGQDGFVQATLAVAPGENNVGLIFRWNNATNSGYQLLFFTDGNYYVNRYDSGSATTVFTHACHSAPDNGQIMRADYAGTVVTISCNGSVLGTFTDSLYNTNTFAGIYFGSSSGTTTRITTWSAQGGGLDRRLVASPLSGNALFEEDFTTFYVKHNALIDGQITSAAPVGTPPAVVASTTKVTNWNADLLDGLDSTAFALAGHVYAATPFSLNGAVPSTGSTTVIAGSTCVCQDVDGAVALGCSVSGTTLGATTGPGIGSTDTIHAICVY